MPHALNPKATSVASPLCLPVQSFSSRKRLRFTQCQCHRLRRPSTAKTHSTSLPFHPRGRVPGVHGAAARTGDSIGYYLITIQEFHHLVFPPLVPQGRGPGVHCAAAQGGARARRAVVARRGLLHHRGRWGCSCGGWWQVGVCAEVMPRVGGGTAGIAGQQHDPLIRLGNEGCAPFCQVVGFPNRPPSMLHTRHALLRSLQACVRPRQRAMPRAPTLYTAITRLGPNLNRSWPDFPIAKPHYDPPRP